MAHLTIKWHIGREEESGSAQLKAYFSWKKGGTTVQSGSFTVAQLDSEIQKLEDKGMRVPPEFFDALLELKKR